MSESGTEGSATFFALAPPLVSGQTLRHVLFGLGIVGESAVEGERDPAEE